MSSPIRLALIGAGIFVKDAHIPALQKLQDIFQVVAVWSRTEGSARGAAALLGPSVAVSTDLNALLKDPQIEAVDIVLPIPVMPDVTAQVLRQDKHLISEKPIAAEVAVGRQLLDLYAQQSGQVWMVGENWRYESAFVRAAALVRDGAIGKPLTCHIALYLPMLPNNKYFQSRWRLENSFAGGLLLDGGVHHIAILRQIVGEISAVSAVTNKISSHLPYADTLSATLRFANGVLGSYLVSYAVGAPWPPYLSVVGDQGALRVQRGEIELTQAGTTQRIPCEKLDGIDNELRAFAAAIRHGSTHVNTPEEALRDVAVIEAMLQATATGKSIDIG